MQLLPDRTSVFSSSKIIDVGNSALSKLIEPDSKIVGSYENTTNTPAGSNAVQFLIVFKKAIETFRRVIFRRYRQAPSVGAILQI